MSFLPLLATVAPVFLTILAGYFIRRVNWLSAEADASLLRVVVNLLVPCLILDTIIGNQAVADAGNLLLAPLVGFGTVVLGFGLCSAAAPLLGLRDARARRTFAFTTGLYNYGYVPLPLIQNLFDQSTAAVLFIHNVGVEIALWTAGILLIRGAAPRGGWKGALNAPVITIVLAVALHFAGGRTWLPAFALQAMHGMGAAAIPLGLILTGATFYDEMPRLSLKGATADSLGACLLRCGVLPLLFLALARWLPCPVELRRVIVVQAAMPCAMIPVILSKHYGGDPALALRIVLITSLLGLLTIPWWIQFGLWWADG
ncbi:MAG: AEC family transporter [Verrucomicrobiota bacterium]|nr:AEC family transporter [Verrucomicrobiota bacterium]